MSASGTPVALIFVVWRCFWRKTMISSALADSARACFYPAHKTEMNPTLVIIALIFGAVALVSVVAVLLN